MKTLRTVALGLCLCAAVVEQGAAQDAPPPAPAAATPAAAAAPTHPKEKPPKKAALHRAAAKPTIAAPAPAAQPETAQAGGPTAPSPAAPTAPASAAPIGELEPVLHARSAGITTCMDNIVTQSASVIDRPHTAVSTWVSRGANAHAFQSIIGLSYPNKTVPNGAAIIFAAPVSPTSCEGGSVQIYPTVQSCSVIQAALIKTGKTIAALQGLPVVETSDGARNLLMPTAGAGCVVVTVRPR